MHEGHLSAEPEERQKKNREAEQKNLKEKKKRHYLKNVQVQSRPVNKKKSKKGIEREQKILKERPVYNNPIRKFIAWLNCEYDQYQ